MTETDKDDLVVRLRHPAWTTNPSGESIFAAGQAIAEMSEAAAEIERLRLQLARATWQPIETAPRDGTKIDVWITPPIGALTVGGYGRASDCWFSDEKWWLYDETKYASDAANCRTEVWHVTHWMPRPAPPVPLPDDKAAIEMAANRDLAHASAEGEKQWSGLPAKGFRDRRDAGRGH